MAYFEENIMPKGLLVSCGAVIIINLLFVGILPVGVCETQEVLEISVDEAAKAMVDGQFDVILDVREPQEYNLMHIPGAVLVPLNTLKEETQKKLGDPDSSILAYCSIGGRSLEATKILQNMGYTNVINLKGGIVEWKEKGYPVIE